MHDNRGWLNRTIEVAEAIERDLEGRWRATPEEGDALLRGRTTATRYRETLERQQADWDAVLARWQASSPRRRRATRRERIVLFELFSAKRSWRCWVTRESLDYRLAMVSEEPKAVNM